MATVNKADKIDSKQKLRGFLWGVGVWAATAPVFILAAALVSFASDDPDASLGAFALAALYLSAAASGIAAASSSGEFLPVALVSLTITAVVLLAATLRTEGAASYNAAMYALLYFLVAATTAAAGFFTLLVKAKRSAKPKRRSRKR